MASVQAEVEMVQAFDFALQPAEVAVIEQHVVRLLQALLATGLGLKDRLHLVRTDAIPFDGAGHLQ